MKRPAAVLAAIVSVACGQPLMKLPSGPGLPAPDVRTALEQATAACGKVATITAEIAASGSVGGRRLRARLLIGLAAPASARIEAVAAFGPVFVFVAQGDDATLLLTHDDRVLEHGPPAAVLEAIAGIPLSPGDLRTAITGCVTAPDPQRARQLGPEWIVMPDGSGEIYLRRSPQTAPWQLVAAVHRDAAGGEWRAEYQNFQQGLAQSVRFTSADARRFDLRLPLTQVETNTPLDDAAFHVRVPPSAAPITLNELRTSGPLAESPRQ